MGMNCREVKQHLFLWNFQDITLSASDILYINTSSINNNWSVRPDLIDYNTTCLTKRAAKSFARKKIPVHYLS